MISHQSNANFKTRDVCPIEQLSKPIEETANKTLLHPRCLDESSTDPMSSSERLHCTLPLPSAKITAPASYPSPLMTPPSPLPAVHSVTFTLNISVFVVDFVMQLIFVFHARIVNIDFAYLQQFLLEAFNEH